MKRKEAIEKSLEEIPVQEMKPGPTGELDEARQKMKPSLLKRIFGGLLDVLIAAVFVFGIQVLLYYTAFHNFGYFDAMDQIYKMELDSHLYVDVEPFPMTIDQEYNNSLSIEENYDAAITYYYSTDARCIQNNKLEKYNNKKLEKYYTFDGENYVRTEFADETKLQTFYSEQYGEALNFFASSSEFINLSNKTFLITAISLITNVAVVTTIYYFVIPLFNKRKQTLGQFIFKIFVVDKETLQEETLKQHFIRFLVFDILVIISPITLLFVLPDLFGMPILVHMAVLCFSYSNCGVHDFAAHTFVGNISKTNSGEILNTLRQMEGNNNDDTTNK